jgi:predicted transcriptional regulator
MAGSGVTRRGGGMADYADANPPYALARGMYWCYMFVMTKIQAQIIELFKTLDQTEQREVAQQLYERAVVGSFYDRMTPRQRAELDEGIAQAERGQVRPADEVFDRLAKRFGFSADHSPRHGLRRPLRM